MLISQHYHHNKAVTHWIQLMHKATNEQKLRTVGNRRLIRLPDSSVLKGKVEYTPASKAVWISKICTNINAGGTL